MKLLKVVKSKKEGKKWDAIFLNDNGKEKSVSFGQKGADDFTKTNDVPQRRRYRNRHKKDLETNDPTRAGYLAYFLLWNKPTLEASIKDYKKRFNM